MKPFNSHGIAATSIGVAVLTLSLTGCSYQQSRESAAQVARTQSSIQQAEQSGAQDGALPELQSAKDKLAEAERELGKKNKESELRALRLTEQAEVDAQYAAAKAQTRKQQMAAQEVQNSIEALRRETNVGSN